MGKTSNRLGAVVLTHKGYTVRQLLNSKTDSKTKKTSFNHTGKYGLYAGKKLIMGDINQPNEVLHLIEVEIDGNKKARATAENKRLADAKKAADAFAKANRRVW